MKQSIDQNGVGTVKSAKFFTVRNMAFIAVMAALICVAAPWSVPMPGLVPVSLASFAVYLAGSLLGWKKGTIAVLIYVLLGAVGLPVFSGCAGGLAKLFGVTGGYIVGYIPCALIGGLFVDIFYKKSVSKNPILNGTWAIPAGMIAGTAILYSIGTVWFVIARGVTLEVALASCVVPFLIGDTIKIICATIITIVLRDRLAKIMK